MKPTIFVLEDSADYRLMLGNILGSRYTLTFAETAEEAYSCVGEVTFDLYLLDIVLPDGSGLQVCNYIKSQKSLKDRPVILLTSKGEVMDKVTGFDFGADDYITKPFHFEELVARIDAKLRNLSKGKDLVIEDLEVQREKQQVKFCGKPIDLTPLEYRLFIFLIERLDHVLSRQQILEGVWPDNLNISDRTVDSHVSNLRKKTANVVSIVAVQGNGYRCSIGKKAA